MFSLQDTDKEPHWICCSVPLLPASSETLLWKEVLKTWVSITIEHLNCATSISARLSQVMEQISYSSDWTYLQQATRHTWKYWAPIASKAEQPEMLNQMKSREQKMDPLSASRHFTCFAACSYHVPGWRITRAALQMSWCHPAAAVHGRNIGNERFWSRANLSGVVSLKRYSFSVERKSALKTEVQIESKQEQW